MGQIVIKACWVLWASIYACTAKAALYWPLATPWSVGKIHGKDRSELTSNLADQEIGLAGFRVRWQQEDQQLSIYGSAYDGRPLWTSVPGYPFVQAAKGRERVYQWRGSFNIWDAAGDRRCYLQTVDMLTHDGTSVKVRGQLRGDACELSYELRFDVLTPRRLGFELRFFDAQGQTVDDRTINRSLLIYASQADEQFFGFGEQFTYFDLKGRVVPIFGQEQGHLRGALEPASSLLNTISPGAAGAWHTTYTAVPFYVTSLLRGFLLDQSEYLYFDLRDPNRVEARVWAASMQGQLIDGASPLELIESFTEVSGRMPRLPDWFHQGAIVGLMGGEEFIREIHQHLRERQTPIAAYWIQDWVGKRQTAYGVRMWWNWELDEQAYPHWQLLTEQLHAEGIRTLGYINPFLSDVSGKLGVRRNLFAEAKARGYLVQDPAGQPYEIDSGGFTGTLIDLSNPSARQWLKQYLKEELFARGFSGWMADFGEALPFDARLASGEPASRFHNSYLTEWARLNREVIDEAGKLGDTVFFVRNAGLRSPQHATMFWLGDQMTTWDEHDGLKSALTGLMSGGISGMALNHGDIGGLIAMRRRLWRLPLINIKRDKELMLRWLELSAFTLVFRTHEGNSPDLSHQFYSDAETLDAYAYFAKVFAALFPYRSTLVDDANQRGYPVIRHPWLHFPEDREVRQLKYQFMLGPDFMVAPVTEPGVTQSQIYLPAGSWIDLWTGRELKSPGKWFAISAKLGFPPVFFRAESQAAWECHQRVQAIARPVAHGKSEHGSAHAVD